MSLAIGYVHPGTVSGAFMQSVVDYLYSDHLRAEPRLLDEGGAIAIQSGPRIAASRNKMVGRFLETGLDWLLMIDSDMVFQPEDVELLFSVADKKTAPIVGGLAFAGGMGQDMRPTLFRLKDPRDGGELVECVHDYPQNAVCEVDATGAAFLLVHRDAFNAIGEHNAGPSPWFIESMTIGDAVFGEDMAFCIRARQVGIPIHVHTGARIGHVKTHVLTEDLYLSQRVKGGNKPKPKKAVRA